jgi:hypothetical protein
VAETVREEAIGLNYRIRPPLIISNSGPNQPDATQGANFQKPMKHLRNSDPYLRLIFMRPSEDEPLLQRF